MAEFLTFFQDQNIVVQFLMVLVSFGLLLFTYITSYIGWVRYKYRNLPGPPYHSFYLGHLPEIKAYRSKKYISHHLFLDWAEKYGPCYRVFVMHKCIISVNSVNLIKEILTKSKYSKSASTYRKLFGLAGARFLGTGILTEVDHNKWYGRRMIINPAFHKKYLRMFMSQFNAIGDKWISSLAPLADGSTMISMHDSLCRVTLDAISEVGFNYKMNAIESGDNQFITSILTILQGMSKLFKDPLFNIRPSEKAFRQRIVSALRFLRDDYGKSMLSDRLNRVGAVKSVGMGNGNGKHAGNGNGMHAGDGKTEENDLPEDILSHIIRTKEQNPELTDEDLLDDVMTLFIAGQETTSNALSFLFLEVGKRPEVMFRLQEEIDSVLEGREFVTFDDLTQMEYVGQVFKETLRLYPPAPGTSRDVHDEVTVDGFTIPAGSFVVTSFFVAHRLSRNFSEPEEFKPERFDKSEHKPLFKFLPFSAGHRSCVGQQFATIEAKLLICKFFQKYTLTLDPDQSFEIQENATLRPQSGCRMIISPRN